jgi:hypothetical protein
MQRELPQCPVVRFGTSGSVHVMGLCNQVGRVRVNRVPVWCIGYPGFRSQKR